MQTRALIAGRDDELLFEAFRAARWDEVRGWGFGEQEATAFLRMQHQAQRCSYAATFPHAEWLIIERDALPVGYCCLARSREAIRLVDIALLSGFRGRGIGSQLVRSLQAEARALSVAVHLSVRPDSQARRLYERLGFRATHADEASVVMRWSSADAERAS